MSFLDRLKAAAEAAAPATVKPRKAATFQQRLDADAEGREHLYQPHRLVALFYTQHCLRCDGKEDVFEGIFEERKHVRVSDLHMVRQPFVPLSVDNTLPRVRKYLQRDLPYCAACSDLTSYAEDV